MRQLAAVALLAALTLVGCAVEGPQPAPTTAPSTGQTSSSTPPSTAPAGESPAAESPSGEASSGESPGASPGESTGDAELDAFRAALGGHSPADADALVAAVEAAGFDRAAIERTREVDSLGKPVTFLEIAVRLGESCLVGQVGDGEPLAVRTTALGGGRCLVGEIVTVD